jgi:CheY-like chemotaxis protein
MLLETHGNYSNSPALVTYRNLQVIVFSPEGLMTTTSPSTIQVLLIDDDEVSRELLTLLLTAQGYAVEAADCGQAALDLLHASSTTPHGILTDLQMPGIAGAELARKLRAACAHSTAPQPLLLAMSGSIPDQPTRSSFDGFLLKPFTMQDFAAALTMTPAKDAPATPAPHTPICLDEDTYRKLASSMKPEQIQQLYAMCLRDIEARVAKMRTAIAGEDDTLYRQEAHAIKGGAGMLGAVEIHALAAAMEKQGLAATNHVASLDEMLLSSERLRVILIEHEKLGQVEVKLPKSQEKQL